MTAKIPAYRASVLDMRKSLEVADQMVRSGIAFVCVPYFSDAQKEAAASLAAYHFESVDTDTD
ncbi:DUF1382 family protein [Paenalcaligenes suwonensis]|uniref:DUF1382 family protein n=1 Tax=Paenalcaligenes suwonensis TaxID=1202713 RepID=UPI00140A87C9|nr:DUF1382 family protein [Paenalcaligenes suwonensis]NHC62739.1 DUF1382 family protein [Paenalcaligenes suwonensis]